MRTFSFTVTVTADSRAEAERVMSERLHHDEDYGFEYEVGYESPEDALIWESDNGGFQVYRDMTDMSQPFTLYHHGEWVGEYAYSQQAKRDAVPQDCSKCDTNGEVERHPCEGCGNVIPVELDWCGGCACSECGEGHAEPGDYGMCGSCLHDAFRSGWVPGDTNGTARPLPLHRTEAGYPNCSTCDGGGCLDCTDPA